MPIPLNSSLLSLMEVAVQHTLHNLFKKSPKTKPVPPTNLRRLLPIQQFLTKPTSFLGFHIAHLQPPKVPTGVVAGALSGNISARVTRHIYNAVHIYTR